MKTAQQHNALLVGHSESLTAKSVPAVEIHVVKSDPDLLEAMRRVLLGEFGSIKSAEAWFNACHNNDNGYWSTAIAAYIKAGGK